MSPVADTNWRRLVSCPPFDRWVGYEHENFRGRQYLWDMSERGEYNCYDKWCAQGDHVSSVRAVKQVKTGCISSPSWIEDVPPLNLSIYSLLANNLQKPALGVSCKIPINKSATSKMSNMIL